MSERIALLEIELSEVFRKWWEGVTAFGGEAVAAARAHEMFGKRLVAGFFEGARGGGFAQVLGE